MARIPFDGYVGKDAEPEEASADSQEVVETPPAPPQVIDEAVEEYDREGIDLRNRILAFRKDTEFRLPVSKSISDYPETIKLDPELIEGMIRVGQNFIFSGASKAGKSFFMIELALCIATGRKLLDKFQCRKGKVLLLNLEINENSYEARIEDVAKDNGLVRADYSENMFVKHMRGMNVFLPDIADELIASMLEDQLNDPEHRPYSAVIIDPIYKVMDGEENSARDVGNFFNLVDKISRETGASVFLTHHHSKGDQGGKRAQDRSSGSGVFARAPDVICDVITLEVKSETRDALRNNFLVGKWKALLDDLNPEWDEGLTDLQRSQAHVLCEQYRTMSGVNTYKMNKLKADFDYQFDVWVEKMVPMRFEFTLRDFAPIKPVNVFFCAPIHSYDKDNVLSMADPESHILGQKKESASDKRRHTLNSFRECVNALIEEKGEATFSEVMTELGISRNTLKSRLVDLEDEFEYTKGGGAAKSVIRHKQKDG